MNGTQGCKKMENKLVEYLDGRARPAERRAMEEHLTACADCRVRADEFRMVWDAMDDVPVLENYDVLSKFDALSELPAPASVAQGEVRKETR